ncbi:fatty acid hydroxylase superfamily-domain-containing protein [Dendryphion nanum]|uniref:Fatty acid hydroxylase superfamily-domain-containing protein n=1 Tax=Dendryphion nanum TaxID=256645 RepID=A0A9P9DZN5_9PLEO|nr:fatty acid hydroxylase superfamily-domain-containing protein [Dendryphion nanum]
MMAANMSAFELPPLPDYTMQPLPPLVPWISDANVALALPIISYWVVSGFFHIIDVYDLFPQYRLHTPAEVLKRNHVTRWECFRDVILQQIIQTVFGLLMGMLDEAPMTGKDDFNVAWYAQKIRIAQRALPVVLATIGFNPAQLASKAVSSYPMLAGALAGGRYSGLVQSAIVEGQMVSIPAFASWELLVAKVLYWYGVPALQFIAGFLLLDTWEYFLHRAMHMNKWLYVTFHSRHHRLYVPYAYGALYNHPFEGFLLDTLGTGLAYLMVGMTPRQSIWFFTCSTVKTVDDHCGYKLPFDPLQHITSNNAAYHDIHHQSWGIKSNFSQPCFTFWDRYLGTMWQGDVAAKYERARRTAQHKLDQEIDNKASAASGVETTTTKPVSTPLQSRKKASSISSSPSGLKGLRNKVNESLHGRGANVLGVESRH